jgi:RHS repeat-associated protein
MTSPAKATVWQATWKPWGEVQTISGTNSNNLRFPGQYFQIETGFHYNHHRMYDPVTGRYTQPDPLGFIDGPSVYAYAKNSPFMYTDREGLAVCTYSITTHTLVCAPNGPPTSDKQPQQLGPDGVFSGYKACTNNSSCSNDPNDGPIPPGNYNMNEDTRAGHEGFWRLEPDPKVPAWKYYLGLERNGFMLHPGGLSLGCITADKKNKAVMEQYGGINQLLQQEKGHNRLRVNP